MKFIVCSLMLIAAAASAADPVMAYEESYPTLVEAVRGRHLGEVKRHLDAGDDPYALYPMEYRGKDVMGPVAAEAVRTRTIEILQAFLDAGVDPNKPLPFEIDGKKVGIPPLIVAIESRLKNVQYLIDHGASLDIAPTEDYQTPLIEAVLVGNNMMIKYLIGKGADVNGRGFKGITPLHAVMAIRPTYNWNETIFKALLDRGADFTLRDAKGRTPLFWAAENGRRRILDLLIEKGADPLLADYKGMTPEYAAEENNHEAIAMILDRIEQKKLAEEEMQRERLNREQELKRQMGVGAGQQPDAGSGAAGEISPDLPGEAGAVSQTPGGQSPVPPQPELQP